MKAIKKIIILLILIIAVATIYYFCNEIKTDVRGKVVVCIPVYGQSLALGEEAVRITDFDDFSNKFKGRIVTENIDNKFGYFDGNMLKQKVKKYFHYRKRSFELSIYSMSASLASQLGEDTVICTFPGGQGATALKQLSKGTAPYSRFLSDIERAHRLAREGGADFFVPAICWMQGESDIADYPETCYKDLLKKFEEDINQDVKAITHQTIPVRIICYQANALSRGEKYRANTFDCTETSVPQAFVELLQEDSLFWASGPTYPYKVVREAVHIDAIGQQHIGQLAANSALSILRKETRQKGLIPEYLHTKDSVIVIHFNVPCPPLVLDTTNVSKADNYGFSVINTQNEDIIYTISLDSCDVKIKCLSSPIGCKVRYAVNGDYMKSGNLHGPRGNLRDSQGDKKTFTISNQKYPVYNWCYQFDFLITE